MYMRDREMKKYRLTGYRISAMSNLIPTLRDRIESLEFNINKDYDWVSTEDKVRERQECNKLYVALAVFNTYFHRDSLQQYKVWINEFAILVEDFIIALDCVSSLVDKSLNNTICKQTEYGVALNTKYYRLIKSIFNYHILWDNKLKEEWEIWQKIEQCHARLMKV